MKTFFNILGRILLFVWSLGFIIAGFVFTQPIINYICYETEASGEAVRFVLRFFPHWFLLTFLTIGSYLMMVSMKGKVRWWEKKQEVRGRK